MFVRGLEAKRFDAGPRYRVVGFWGEGSYGAVYEAVDAVSGKRVALKTLHRVSESALTRFKREFRALSEVNHMSLVGLRELYEHKGTWLIAMDLVEGTDLLSYVRAQGGLANEHGLGFDEARVRTCFAHVAQGLHVLHRHGLLHRD